MKKIIWVFLFLFFIFWWPKTKINKINKISKEDKINKINEIFNKLWEDVNNFNHEKNPLKGVPLYYINMDKSKERRYQVEKQLKALELKGTRIRGIVGKTLPKHSSLSPSEVGCLMSHIKAIKTAYENGDTYAIIFEDDINLLLTSYWPVNLSQITNGAKGWNIINLYPVYRFDTTEDYLRFPHKNPCWGCVAYIINREGMKNIMEETQGENSIKIPKDRTKAVADYFIYEKAGKSYEYYKHHLFMCNTLVSTITEGDYILEEVLNNTLRAFEDYNILDV